MSRLFLDTEWSDVRGTELVSLALIDESGERGFYAEVDPLPRNPTDFARFVVYPQLERGWAAMQAIDLTHGLRNFLGQFEQPVVMYDHPTDGALFRLALDGFGRMIQSNRPQVRHALLDHDDLAPHIERYFDDHAASARLRHHARVDAEALRWAFMRNERKDSMEQRKVIIGRRSNGWNTTGLVALFADNSIVEADTPAELLEQLMAAGVDRECLVLCGPDEGDHALSQALRDQLLELIHQPPPVAK